MPKRTRPEFFWDEKHKRYRKRVKGPDGKWHDAYGKTKPECRAKAEELRQRLSADYVPPEMVTVAQYAKTWYDLNTGSMKPATRARYATNINKHICPVIGAMYVSQVRHDDIKRIMAGCSGLSKATKAKVLTATRKIFDAAVKNEMIEKNPCYDLKAEGRPAEKRVALTKAQQAQLLAAVKGTNAETFVKLCLYAGLRREEALGLFWDKVDLDAETPFLSVRRVVNFGTSGQPELLEYGKSDAAIRDIPIPAPLLEHLQAIRKDAGPVVPNKSGGVMSKQSFRKLWDIVNARTVHEAVVLEDGKKVTRMLQVGEQIPRHNVTIMLDFRVTPHMLRHTYISELILAGANVKTAQYLAGHASAQITLDIYTHLMENRPKDTQSAVFAAFGGIPQGQC